MVNSRINIRRKIMNAEKYNNSAERIALYVINSGKEITNLLLQKMLWLNGRR